MSETSPLRTDSLTVLRVVKAGGIATKRYVWTPPAKHTEEWRWQKFDYDAGSRFVARPVTVSSVYDIGAFINNLRRDCLSLIIRGQLRSDIDPNVSVRRKYKADASCPNPPFVDVPRRWLMADVDGWPIPEALDLIEDTDAIIERAITELLPEPFHDCAAFWQLSASSGFKPGTLRVHLWFWLDRPVETEHLRKWMSLNSKDIDLSLFNAVQIHYTGDPIIQGGHDPIPRRTGWVQGSHDFVTLPDVNPSNLNRQVNDQRRANAMARGLSASQANTVDGAFAEMGDGEELNGFHAPLLRAGMLYARATPPWERDAEALKARMRDAINTAPKKPDRDVSNYLTDDYLDRNIGGAFARVPKVGVWETCSPEYALPSGDAGQARARMRGAIAAFLAAPVHQPSPLMLALSPSARATPRRGLIVAEVGLGKTAAALEAIAKFIAAAQTEQRPCRVLYAVPEHRLGAEMVVRARALGIFTATWHGREYASEETGPMCDDLESVILAQEVSAGVTAAVCGSATGKNGHCEFLFTCAYQRQRPAAAKADLVIASHQILFNKLPEEISDGLGLVVVDESFWQSGLRHTSITTATFSADPLQHPVLKRHSKYLQVTDEEATNDLHAIRAKLQPALDAASDGYLKLEHVLSAGITEDECALAIKLEWKRQKIVMMAPGMPRENRKKANEDAAINAQIPRMVAFWTVLKEQIQDRIPETGRIELANRKTRDGDQRVAVVNMRRALADAVLACPILLLDGTADIDVVRHFFPDVELLTEERPAVPHMTVRQVVGALSKTSLHNRSALVAEIRDFVSLKARGEPALVVANLEFEKTFEGSVNVSVAHFGAIAERDEWRAVRHLFVIGGTQPSPADTRMLAAQLTGKPISLANPSRTERGVLMADGSGVEIEVSRFDNPDLEAIRAAVADATIIQAVGRGRGVNRTAADPLDVWLIGNVITPWPVAEIMRWPDVALRPVMRMAARGLVLESPADMATIYPDLFPTQEAAKKARQREVGDIPLYNTIIRECPQPRPVEVRYQPAGAGRTKRSAWVTNPLPWQASELRTRLEAALGALADFEVVKPEIADTGAKTPPYVAAPTARPTAGLVVLGDAPPFDIPTAQEPAPMPPAIPCPLPPRPTLWGDSSDAIRLRHWAERVKAAADPAGEAPQSGQDAPLLDPGSVYGRASAAQVRPLVDVVRVGPWIIERFAHDLGQHCRHTDTRHKFSRRN